ncbi:MAG: NAD-dependent epimerase/dehydratase family protein [Deltaproteobacteria bacterium]|nr:NAD-dependent epimerase/dehydratase family protein [Deltaproteobacteria bacterium]
MLPGVTIADHAVVGPNAVVTRNYQRWHALLGISGAAGQSLMETELQRVDRSKSGLSSQSLRVPERVTRAAKVRKIGFAGTGYIADWHAKALAWLPDVQLGAVCDQVLPRANAFAQRFRVPKVYESLEAMLAGEQLDAVHVLLPPDLHYEAAQQVLKAGADVLLEKPMCIRGEDCEALIRLADARSLRIGVGHNYQFADPYEQLRQDVHSGILGPIDQVVISWYRELPQLKDGPFDTWMLREPSNILFEVGCHPVSLLLDLLGRPNDLRVDASNSITLPSGEVFHRHWQVNAAVNHTAVQLRLSFVPGLAEFTVHLRGLLGSAIVDFEGNTYTLRRHHALSDDLDRFAMTVEESTKLRRQARRTLLNYGLAKLHWPARGNPYEASIAGELRAFYAQSEDTLDPRVCGSRGAEIVQVCEQLARTLKPVPKRLSQVNPVRDSLIVTSTPRTLVLGASGFIGQVLLSKLVQNGSSVRVLLRSPGKLPQNLRGAQLEIHRGDLANDRALRQAMNGIETVYHLARANAKTWSDWQRDEIDVTRRVAKTSLAAGVKRLIYTGTIDSYYGGRADTITEDTPLDRRIERRNLYARAKAASEAILWQMHREHGLPVVILRPGIVIGRGGSPFHWGVGMWWQQSVCQLWGQGRNKLPLVLVLACLQGPLWPAGRAAISATSRFATGGAVLSASDRSHRSQPGS